MGNGFTEFIVIFQSVLFSSSHSQLHSSGTFLIICYSLTHSLSIIILLKQAARLTWPFFSHNRSARKCNVTITNNHHLIRIWFETLIPDCVIYQLKLYLSSWSHSAPPNLLQIDWRPVRELPSDDQLNVSLALGLWSMSKDTDDDDDGDL